MCLKHTAGPHSNKNQSLKTGHAAHINAAAPGGPRYNSLQTSEERRNISNGIWACRDCGDQIDKDHNRYTESDLRKRKTTVEIAIDYARRSGFVEGYRALNELAPQSDFANIFSFRQALTNNHNWLSAVFSRKADAKRHFGQTLAPAAQYPFSVLPRTKNANAIINAIQGGDDALIAVIGEEGAGKSWLVAKSLLDWKYCPLVVFMSAKDINPSPSYTNIVDQIVDRLILQSGERQSNSLQSYWLERFARWSLEAIDTPRLIVCIDGLNENPLVNWPRWINGASTDLNPFARLIITDRKAHFRQTIEAGLATSVNSVLVDGWSREELEFLLSGRNVNIDSLDSEVLKSLQTPRLLGIALSLDKLPLAELSRQRLLFEYIRFSQAEDRLGESPLQFSRRLADHADDVRSKALQQQTQALGRYAVSTRDGAPNFALSLDLLHASTSQFYTQLPTPGQYRLSEDGLNVALGIGIISALKEATADGKAASEAIESLLEPIEALDMTADVVFAAMQVAAADDGIVDVQSALLGRFLQLQNISSKLYPGFLHVIRRSVGVALDALYEINRNTHRPSLKNWLIRALRDLRDDEDAWTKMLTRIDQWLRLYTLEPEPRHASFGQTPAEAKERFNIEARRIRDNCRALTQAERRFLKANCKRDDSFDSSALVADGLLLLAGKPIAKIAPALFAWTFHHSLNSWWDAPDDEFGALIRFNVVDWQETETALRVAAQELLISPISKTGQWCLAFLWWAIATDEAQRDREVLLDILRPERHEWKGGRLVEKMSLTDPCDPYASPPEDLSFAIETATKQDFTALYKNRSGKDILLLAAEPALSRWLPVLAVQTERRAAAAILAHEPPGLGLGVHELSAETAVLENAAVEQLVEIARRYSRPTRGDTSSENEEWRAAQFALLGAVPHLSPEEQFALLNSLSSPGPILVATAEMFGEVDRDAFEIKFLEAYKRGHEDMVIAHLCFAIYSGTKLSIKVQEIILSLALEDRDETFLAVETLATQGDVDLLVRFAESGWRAAEIEDKSKRAEKFYGSIILIEASALGRLDVLELLERIDFSAFNFAAQKLGKTVAQPLTHLLASCVSRVANASLPIVKPAATKNIDSKDIMQYPRTDIQLDEPAGFKESLERAGETDEEFQYRVQSANQRYRKFEDELERIDASEVLKYIGRRPIELAAEFQLEEVKRWASICLRTPVEKRQQMANLAVTIGSVLIQYDEATAANLFLTYAEVEPTINLTYDLRQLGHLPLSLWAHTSELAIRDLRTRILNEANSDQEIAANVDAALEGKQEAFLKAYVERTIQSPIPAVKARGLIVAGFMDEAHWIDSLFNSLAPEMGLVADALRTAKYAYDRNRWSKHWVREMVSAKSGADFWRFSIIFRKIVDFRFEHWIDDLTETESLWNRFSNVFRADIKRRIKKWKDERAKTLLGNKVPPPQYVQRY